MCLRFFVFFFGEESFVFKYIRLVSYDLVSFRVKVIDSLRFYFELREMVFKREDVKGGVFKKYRLRRINCR